MRDQQHDQPPRTFSRRAILRLTVGAAGVATLAACGGNGTIPTAGSTGGGATPTAAGGSATATTGAKPTSAATGAASGGAGTATAPSVAASPARGSAVSPTGATTASPGASPGADASGRDASGRIAGTLPGVPDVYVKPPPLFKSVNGIPGKGGKVTTYQIAYNPPVPPRGENKYWQELEKRLGVQIEATIVPAGDQYTQKIAALTAGGDLPDLTFVLSYMAPDQFKVLQQGGYTDLTSYVTPGALKEYPNLTLFPERIWKNSAYKSKNYGVPKPRFNISGARHFRSDWAKKFNMTQMKNADDYFKLMQDYTKNDPDGNGKADTFGIGAHAADLFSLTATQCQFGVPNGWRKNADGTLTNAIETDEFKAAVAYIRKLSDAGVYHPDSVTMSPNQGKDGFISGRYGSFQDAIGALYGSQGLRAKMKALNPQAEAVALILPPPEGGKNVAYNESGYFGFVAIPTKVGKDQERVKELLRILNYYAAPYGSEENTFLGNGIEGIHHQVRQDGVRVRTDLGKAEIGDLPALMNAVPVFTSDVPGDALEQQGVVTELTKVGLDNPTQGLFSATEAARSSELSQLRNDRLMAIFSGREPLSALDQYIKDWKSRGGDQIRQEYEQELKG